MSSFVPANVFDDAAVLHATYKRLINVTQIKRTRPRGKLGGRDRARMKQAQSDLKQLDRDLLEKLTPEVLQGVLVLEEMMWSPLFVPEWNRSVNFQVLGVAAESVTNAKRLAHLLVHSTILNDSPRAGDHIDLYHAFLMKCLTDGAVHSEGCARLPNYHSFRFVDRLIIAANGGDRVAHDYLRLFHRALRLWKFQIVPGSITDMPADYLACMLGMHGMVEAYHDQGSTAPLPLFFAPAHYPRLKLVYDEEIGRCEDETLARFKEQYEAVPLSAYDRYLTELWDFICAQKVPNLVLSGGRDKVEVRVPYLNFSGIKSFSFAREQLGGGFFTYPAVGVLMFMEKLCERVAARFTLDAEGRIKELEGTRWPSSFAALQWCLIMDAYAEIVLPPDQKDSPDNPRRNRSRLLKPHHAEGDRVDVRAHFAKLPQGWHASEQQIQQALVATGAPPPEGYTFRGEHQRGFPGVPLPYQEARDAWEVHRHLTSSVVINEDYVTKLLEHISTFG